MLKDGEVLKLTPEEEVEFEKWIHSYGKRHFRSYSWDGRHFSAIGRTGITHFYEFGYMQEKFEMVNPRNYD